jgi:YesN/AraC family two-component response regulator
MKSNPILHLLIVDDDPKVLKLLHAVIEQKFGDRVTIDAVNDPRDALRILDAKDVDLLITDLEMPEIDGLELVRSAKQKDAWTQILILTAHCDSHVLVEAMSLGAADYLLKTMSVIDLESIIGGVIDRITRWRTTLEQSYLFV